MENKQNKHDKNHMTEADKNGKQPQQTTTTNASSQKTTSHVKQNNNKKFWKKPVIAELTKIKAKEVREDIEMYRQGYVNSDIPEAMKEAIAEIQYLKRTAIADEFINEQIEEIMAEYAGEEPILKEVANERIAGLYEELWYYNIEKSKYTELALTERENEMFFEVPQDRKDPVHRIIIGEIIGYIVELKIADS